MLGMFKKQREITVTVAAYGLASRFVRPGTYTIKEGASLKALLAEAGLAQSSVPLVFMIQGQRVDPAHKLSDGEAVNVFQLAAGG